ncbi:hypothetical protein [Salirhabdus salicampi]|uniref:hypothetical protein n=1 Tax=Salirhabdus salicampi TaxID=476102 RepID=UPI0020C2BF64|nr:hypothetical protein [Salirhabdus salicampi]MCP8616000.1 hypothetical protein [Salirhabdus salicampi]
MKVLFILLFTINVISTFLLFRSFYRKRKLFDDRFGMTITATVTVVISTMLSMLISFITLAPFITVVVIGVLIGALIGISFGCLVKFQSVVTGFTHGTIGGSMGAMLGSVIQDPTLCSLPSSYLQEVMKNMIYFSMFGTFLIFMTIILISYTMKV